MRLKELLIDFLVIFFITFIVSSLATFIYNLIVHARAIINWETAFILSLVFSIIFPILNYRERKKLN